MNSVSSICCVYLFGMFRIMSVVRVSLPAITCATSTGPGLPPLAALLFSPDEARSRPPDEARSRPPLPPDDERCRPLPSLLSCIAPLAPPAPSAARGIAGSDGIETDCCEDDEACGAVGGNAAPMLFQ